MKGIPSWVTYTVLRLLMFVVPLVVLLLLRVDAWIAVIAAALVGLCLSYIFLRRPREAVSRDLYAARHRDKPLVREDDEAEDAVVDATEQTSEPLKADRLTAESHTVESVESHTPDQKA